MTNDPSSGDQPGWPGGQQAYPGYGQQRSDQPAYGASYPPPPQQGYGQTAPPWAAPAQQPAGQPAAQGASAWSGGSPPVQYPAGLGPGGGLPPANAQGFFGALFDFGFNSFATPVVIKVLYILSLVGIGLTYVLAVVSGFAQDPVVGLITLVAGAVIALLVLVYIRVLLEVLYATIRIAEDVRHLRDRQP
jgi:hypothetical protein